LPDLLTHYTVSYLVSSRFTSARYSIVIALVGLLPDIDALMRVHRWITHSLIVALLAGLLATLVVYYTRPGHVWIPLLALALYILHIVLDAFTAPTPLLYPFTSSSYMVSIGVNGSIAGGIISLKPEATLLSEPVDFTPRQAVEGPVISEAGVIVATSIGVAILAEKLAQRKHDTLKKTGRREVIEFPTEGLSRS